MFTIDRCWRSRSADVGVHDGPAHAIFDTWANSIRHLETGSDLTAAIELAEGAIAQAQLLGRDAARLVENHQNLINRRARTFLGNSDLSCRDLTPQSQARVEINFVDGHPTGLSWRVVPRAMPISFRILEFETTSRAEGLAIEVEAENVEVMRDGSPLLTRSGISGTIDWSTGRFSGQHTGAVASMERGQVRLGDTHRGGLEGELLRVAARVSGQQMELTPQGREAMRGVLRDFQRRHGRQD